MLNTLILHKFITTLKESISDIGEDHFLVKRYMASSVYRERVYCYELYYQWRKRTLCYPQYVIHGELDKSGHEGILSNSHCVPDFLVHKPGDMDNLIVMEVKSIDGYKDYKRDLQMLQKFKKKVNYKMAIWLIFGDDHIENDIIKIFKDAGIAVWHHKKVGTKPVEK